MAENNGLSAAALVLAAANKGGGGGEPAQYLKDVRVSDNTLTIVKKDDTPVSFTPENNIYVATYGTTKFADIGQAYLDGKDVFVRYNNNMYHLSYANTISEFQFTCITMTRVLKRLAVNISDVWTTYADITLQPQIDNNTDLTCRTMDTNLIIETTAPTGPNPLGSNVVRFVRLPQEPATRYDGYWYLIDNKEA